MSSFPAPTAAMQRAALGDVSNLSPGRRLDTIPSPFKKVYSPAKLAPPVCSPGPAVDVIRQSPPSEADVVSPVSDADVDRSRCHAASLGIDDADIHSQQRARTSSEVNTSRETETETESDDETETETECGSETDPYILTDDSLVSPSTAIDRNAWSSSPTCTQQPSRTPRRRSSRKALPIIFFGTPSASEHDKRAKYDSKLRERRLLRRDSLELARRRTLTQSEVSSSVPAHLKHRGSEEDETQDGNEHEKSDAPTSDDATSDETETRDRASSEPGDEMETGEVEKVEVEEEEDEELQPSPCLRPTQIAHELPSLLSLAPEAASAEEDVKETAIESTLGAAPQQDAGKEIQQDGKRWAVLQELSELLTKPFCRSAGIERQR